MAPRHQRAEPYTSDLQRHPALPEAFAILADYARMRGIIPRRHAGQLAAAQYQASWKQMRDRIMDH
jgi:hypothetical protein